MPYDAITDDYGNMLKGSEADRIAEELVNHRENVFAALRKAAAECAPDLRALVYMEDTDVSSIREADAALEGYDWAVLTDLFELAGVQSHAIAAE